MRKRHNLQIGLVAIMKPRNIIFIIASLIVFTALSVISFILAGGNYGAEFIFIFCLAAFLLVIGLTGTVFPQKTYDLFMRLGNKILSWSVYYDDMSAETKQGFKTFNRINKVLVIIGNVLLVVLLVFVLVSL